MKFSSLRVVKTRINKNYMCIKEFSMFKIEKLSLEGVKNEDY